MTYYKYKDRTPENIAHDLEWASWEIACAINTGSEISRMEIEDLKELVEELISKIPNIDKSKN